MSKFLNLLKGDQHPVEPEAEPIISDAGRYYQDMFLMYRAQGKSQRMAAAMAADAAGLDMDMSEDEFCGTGDFDE